MRSRKSTPPGGPPPAKTSTLSGKPAAGTISSAQPVDEVERGRNAVLAPADDLDVEVVPRRVDVLRAGRVERHARDLRIGLEPFLEPRQRDLDALAPRRPPGRAVSMTIAVGASAPSPSSSETMFSPRMPSRSCGMPSFEPGPTSSERTGSASRTRKAVVAAANDRRALHDRPREPRPEVRLGVGAALDDALRDRGARDRAAPRGSRGAPGEASARRRRRRAG